MLPRLCIGGIRGVLTIGPVACSTGGGATNSMSPARQVHDDDAALVARCLHGEAPAWAALVRRYQQLVFAIVRRAGLDEHASGDVFQTVFARLIESLPRINEPYQLLRLLFRDDGAIAYDNVARELDMPVGSIGPTRARCLDQLRRLVG